MFMHAAPVLPAPNNNPSAQSQQTDTNPHTESTAMTQTHHKHNLTLKAWIHPPPDYNTHDPMHNPDLTLCRSLSLKF